jgi:tetratricopeptide (TPR) repeat protein
MFMEILVTMGLLGIAAYLALFGAVFISLAALMRRSGDDKIIGVGFAAMTVAYIIHNSFIFDTSANFITFFSIIGFIAFLRMQGDEPSVPKRFGNVRPLSAGKLAVLVVLLVAMTVVVFRINVRPSLANYATTRGIIAGWQGKFVEAMNSYEESVSRNAFGVYEYRQRMAQYLLEVASQLDEYPEPYVEAVEFAISEVEKNTELNTQDYLPLLYLARLNIILGKTDPASEYNDIALEYTDRALEISPTFVRTYYEVAQAYLNKADYASAYEMFAKAQQLNPEVGITYWYMGVTRFQLGDARGALGLIQEAVNHGYTLTQRDAERLIAVYGAMNDIQSVIGLLEQMVQDYPDKAQYWIALGSAYNSAGMKEQAIIAAQKAIEIDPTLKEAGEEFIQSILEGPAE